MLVLGKKIMERNCNPSLLHPGGAEWLAQQGGAGGVGKFLSNGENLFLSLHHRLHLPVMLDS